MADETCRVEYPRGPNPIPNTRIVRCGKPAGHPERMHAEALEDGEFGPEWEAHDARPAAEAGHAGEALDLDRVRQVLHAATDEPWAIWPDLREHGLIAIGNAAGVIPDGEVWTDGEAETIAHVYTEEDAELIAQAPTLLKTLLAEVERQRAELADLHGAARASYDIRMEYRADRDQARAELAEVTRERDEAREAGIREGREAAAQAIRDRADTIDVEHGGVGPRARLRRHLQAAANIAAGPPTPAEVVTAINDDRAIVCRTADIETGPDDGSGT